MTDADVIALLSGLPGVVAVRAGEDNGAPRVAWGDSFFFYDPDDRPEDRRMPFATVVTHDYAVLDTVVPHPVYAARGWVLIVGPRTASQVRELVEHAHARAVRGWRPRAGG